MASRPPITAASSLAPAREIARIAEMRSVHSSFLFLHNQEMEFRRWQRELTEIPAPPFGESLRTEWLHKKFTSLGLEDVHVDELGNVTGLLFPAGHAPGALERTGLGRSGVDAPLVGISAHLDTVFPHGTALETREEGNRLYGPGISDNAAGVIALLAIAAAIKRPQLRPATNVVFIGNVGEEGEGNLRGMRHIFSLPRWRDSIRSLLVIDGAGTDTYVNQALGSRRFEIAFRGPGGHSWSDFGVPNPIVLLSRALARFSEIPIPESPRTTFNIGVISGGTSVNSIPESATARVDLRSASMEELQKLEDRLRECVAEAWNEAPLSYRAGESRVTLAIESIGDRPAAELPANSRVLQFVRAVDKHLRIESFPRLASTDANVPLSLGIEATTIGAGGDGGGAHTLREWFDCTHRDLGLKRILLVLLALTGVHE
ncbi:MAG TPA: M20/M25/M40 family metallo-hydrolase [Candidatus Angelobacter sp.]|nr:M20/M25/M40 family metallo-hydrolase [Candidatus Angelobacter sp.]